MVNLSLFIVTLQSVFIILFYLDGHFKVVCSQDILPLLLHLWIVNLYCFSVSCKANWIVLIFARHLTICYIEHTFVTALQKERQWDSLTSLFHILTQIISVNSNSETIIQNVPDELATEIPRALLLGFSSSNTVVTRLNKKKWKRQQVRGCSTETRTVWSWTRLPDRRRHTLCFYFLQVELFFDVVAVETATAALGSPNKWVLENVFLKVTRSGGFSICTSD